MHTAVTNIPNIRGKKRVRMTKEKYWLESQGRGERLKHHAGRSEEEKVRRFYKKLVKKRKRNEQRWRERGRWEFFKGQKSSYKD